MKLTQLRTLVSLATHLNLKLVVMAVLGRLGQLVVMAVLGRLGLLLKRAEPDSGGEEERRSYVFVVEGLSPFMVTVSSESLMAMIERQLPVVEYGSFARVTENEEDEEDEVGEKCVICLSCLERCDEVRKLSNCGHVFHRSCLDSWFHQCQVTCPVCRSLVLSLTANK